MVKPLQFSPVRRITLWMIGLAIGIFLFGIQSVFAITLTANTTPAITSATFESTGTVTGLVVEFNRPVWTDSALTGALTTADFAYVDTNSAGAGSLSAIAHTAGDDFAVLTLNADPAAADTDDTIAAISGGIFTVGGALSSATVALTDDDGTLPAISTVEADADTANSRILVTFNKRVWSDDTTGAPPTTAPAVADFTIVSGNGAAGCQTALAANLLVRPGARKVMLDCGEDTVAGDITADTLAAASGTSLNDAWGNDMGAGTVAFTADAAAPTIINIEAVKDSTFALIVFSEPVFTDDPAAGTNPGTIVAADFTYSNGASTAGAASISSISTGTSQSFQLIGTGSGNNYAVLTLDAAVSIADLSGGAADDTIDVANGTAVVDAFNNGITASGTAANRTLNDRTRPVIATLTFDKTAANGFNTVAFTYSEDVTLTGAPAAGLNQASTASVGDMTTACTAAGFGAFVTGNLTYPTLLNRVEFNAAETIYLIRAAGQSGGYRTSTASPIACSGNFTPTANVADVAPTPNTIAVTSIFRGGDITTTAAWDTANPLTAQVTTASSATTTTATIGWTAVTDAGTDFREYKFFYGTTTGAGASLAGTQWGVASDSALTTRTTTTTTITGLNSGTVYYITPYVFDSFGNAATAAAEMNIQTNSTAVSSDRTAPAAPTNVKIESKDGKAVLTWTDPTASDLKDIVVLRGKNEFPVSGNAYALVNKAVQTYTDSDVVAGDMVKYILRGRDTANNESANSTEVSVTIVAATPPPTIPAPPDTTPPPAEGEGEGEGEPAEGEGEGEPVSEAFSDVEEDHWAVAVIQHYFDMGVVKGYSDGTFRPGKTANRAEALKMVMAAYEIDVEESVDEKPFSDVDTSEWFAPYVAQAKEQGFVKGRQGKFEGGADINRAEVLALILQVSGVDVEDFVASGEASFKDVKSSDWFYKYVIYAAENSIVKGYSDGTFKANKSANRAEILQMLGKAQGVVE